MFDYNTSVQLIEESSTIYKCPLCFMECDNLDLHIANLHGCIDVIQCLFCSDICHAHSLGSHVDMHFVPKAAYNYICPICFAGHNSLRSLLLHGKLHLECKSLVLQKCAHCHQKCRKPEDLFNHLKFSKIELYSCCINGCNVKSRSFRHVLMHCKRAHSSGVESICFERDFTCAWPYFLRSIAYASEQPLEIDCRNDNVLNLACSGCSHTFKCLWDYARHFAECEQRIEKEGTKYKLVMYSCSNCFAVSTAASYVAEHQIKMHNRTIMDVKIIANELILRTSDKVPVSSVSPKVSIFEESEFKPFLPSTPLNQPAQVSVADPENISNLMISNENDYNGENYLDESRNSIESSLQYDSLSTEDKPTSSLQKFRSLHFDEKAFMTAFENIIQTPEGLKLSKININNALEIFKLFTRYKVSVIDHKNHRSISWCPLCSMEFKNHFAEVKLHILEHHLCCSHELAIFALKFTKSSVKSLEDLGNIQTPEVNNNSDMESPPSSIKSIPETSLLTAMAETIKNTPIRQNKILNLDEQVKPFVGSVIEASKSPNKESDIPVEVSVVGSGPQKIQTSYSVRVLKQLLNENLVTESEQIDIINRMNDFIKMPIITNLSTNSSNKEFTCSLCNYHAPIFSHIRRHIMCHHFGIPQAHLRACFWASRYNICTFRLLTDERMLELAHRHNSSKQQRPSNPCESAVAAATTNKSRSLSLQSTSLRSTNNGRNKRHFYGETDTDTSSSSENLPYHQEIIRLPFSESVLRTVLIQMNKGSKFKRLRDKMKVYSRYTVTRFENRNCTRSLMCSCGRKFETSRRSSNLSHRFPMLIDVRKHVLRVHAGVHHDFVTLCCRVSRLDPMENFKLLPDAVLLEMAEQPPRSTVPNNLRPLCSKSLIRNEDLDNSNYEQSSSEIKAAEREKRSWEIIKLPFNEAAFRLMVKPILETEKDMRVSMESLLAAMQTYSTYTVMILRTNSKLSYICSSCSFSSIYGVSHVRRHILDFHCHLSFRYQQVCLCCSRLSIRSNKLLSTRQLLQLAVKCKAYAVTSNNNRQEIDKSPSVISLPTKKIRRETSLTLDTIGPAVPSFNTSEELVSDLDK